MGEEAEDSGAACNSSASRRTAASGLGDEVGLAGVSVLARREADRFRCQTYRKPRSLVCEEGGGGIVGDVASAWLAELLPLGWWRGWMMLGRRVRGTTAEFGGLEERD